MASDNETVQNDNSTAQQEARAKLRESFLRALHEFDREPCNILTYEQTWLNATFSGWNTDGSEMFVRDMKTPAGINLTSALLRASDMLAVTFDRPLELP